MTKYVIDTQLYIRADRSLQGSHDIDAHYAKFLPATYLHAVVVQELLTGGTTFQKRGLIQRTVVRPFERRRRVITPSFGSWRRSGEIVGELVERGTLSPGGFAKSFLNDVLLVCSCREEGFTLITANTDDFARIAEVEQFEFVRPWPEE